ncbi:hypothetical protein CCACVL1_28897 [Corchorus capsularis]|uniref:Uncharacterized protein n=1 Tax=Corchorus capsularis TaxID=210143 RepID=A0A1R3G4R4_COCAP|nr:hypothetical protein CCACVL1_28897 [Corchorus capsularis]
MDLQAVYMQIQVTSKANIPVVVGGKANDK